MRAHGKALELAHRIPPPRTTLERIAKRIAAQVVEATPRIEPLVRRAEPLPEGAHAVVMGFDRTTVPMAEERAADAPAKPAPKRRKPRVRKPPKPFDVNYRMAYVGTTSIVDESGNALVTRRYAIPASDDPAAVVARMTADVRRAKRLDPELDVGVVQDRAAEMWNLDRYHLVERLASALEIVEQSASERKALLAEWNDLLDTKDSAIEAIERHLIGRYAELSTAKRSQLWEYLVYIANNKDRMRYVELAVHGLPVGSGVTESAAKTVVGRRTKNSGQRWRDEGLRGALTLRSLEQSNRLPAFWSRFSRRYVATVEAA
jgi:hypothetical protein